MVVHAVQDADKQPAKQKDSTHVVQAPAFLQQPVNRHEKGHAENDQGQHLHLVQVPIRNCGKITAQAGIVNVLDQAEFGDWP